MITSIIAEEFRNQVQKMTLEQISEMLESACINAGREKLVLRREIVAVPNEHDVRYRYVIDFDGNA